MLFSALVVVFLIFTATGSFPIDVAGQKLSNVFTLAFCAMLPLFMHWRVRFSALTLLGLTFCIWQFLSVVWARDADFSAYRALVIGGYVFLALTLPGVAKARGINLSAWYGRVGVLAALALIVCYIAFMPLGSRAVYPQLFFPSMTLAPLDDYELNDPNVVACSLAVAFICAMQATSSWQRRWLFASVIVLALLLTQSRTALLFLPLAAIVAALLTRQWRVLAGAALALACAVGVVALVLQVYDNDPFDLAQNLATVVERFTSDSASNDDRIDRLQGTLLELERPAVALFGLGAGGSISSGLDPHNMFLSFFLELGLPGLMLFCAFFVVIFARAARVRDRRQRFFLLWILLFITLACLTYWHTRTLWFALSLVVFGSAARTAADSTRRPSCRAALGLPVQAR